MEGTKPAFPIVYGHDEGGNVDCHEGITELDYARIRYEAAALKAILSNPNEFYQGRDDWTLESVVDDALTVADIMINQKYKEDESIPKNSE